MNEVLKVILSMSLSGGIVIIILSLVLLLFGKKLSRQWQYYIWLIAIVRLMIPFAPQQNLMNILFQFADITFSNIENISTEKLQNEQNQTNIEQLNNEEGKKLNMKSQGTDDETIDKTVEDSVNKTSNMQIIVKIQHVLLNIVQKYLVFVWLLPAIFLLIRKIIIYQNFIKYIRADSEDVQDFLLLEHFGTLLEKKHIRHAISLSINEIVTSPIIVGFFNPSIILPATVITDSEFEHAILHELVHYKRRDILYKWLTQFTICVHWFNPLSYVLQQKINTACELSCDEVVIQNFNEQERYAYGDTLLHMAGKNVKYKNPISSIKFSDNKKYLKERLDAIMSFQKTTKITLITTFVLSVMIFISSAYLGVYAAEKQTVIPAVISNSKTSGANSAQASHSVIYKNGEYFILFDHANENDIPLSTGPDYGVTFCAVWPDGYASFDSYRIDKNLTKKIKKECKDMQKNGLLTKKEANAIVAVASKVQKGDTKDFQTDKQEKEYKKWKITTKNGIYYYKNKRIRLLIDTRKNHSFNQLYYDKKGKVDIKIVRNKNNSIIKVKYLSKKNAKKILNDLK